MADDTRQDAGGKRAATENRVGYKSPYHEPVTPPENSNMLPGGTQNTAGGKMREATFFDAFKTIKLSDLTGLHQRPCVRDALLTGIAAGFGIGSVRGILGATIWKASNWAVGSFVAGSFLMHEYCQRKRSLEFQGMKRAVEVIDRKRMEKQLEAQSPRTTPVSPATDE